MRQNNEMAFNGAAIHDSAPMPRHVGIIMDGNGRWAAARGMPRVEGHRRGVEALRRTIRIAGDYRIPYVTIYAFSTENWRRPAQEISYLMGLLRRFIRNDLAELHRNGVRVRMIGSRENVPPDVIALMDEAENLTRANLNMTLVVAFNYGARQEIAAAARKLAERMARGEITSAQIDADAIASELDTAGMPDPDLIIRTSGEQRLSNFLLWQAAYAEFVFLNIHWPDFDQDAFDAALVEFRRRDRRYGALKIEEAPAPARSASGGA
jgi:undecaprenyl diphosphate synthase